MMPIACRLLLLSFLAIGLYRPVAAQELELLAESKVDFDRQHDLVLSPDKALLYVADLGNDEIKVLQARSLRHVETIGAGELSDPHDVAFDRKGRLLVADSGHDRIAIFEREHGNWRLTGSLSDGLNSPEGVAELADGRIIATDTRGGALMVYERGLRVLRLESNERDGHRYRNPHDVDVAADGRVYVVDSGNDAIQVLSSELVFERSLAGKPYDFNDPKYLALAGDLVFVADEHNNRVAAFTMDGKKLLQIGSGRKGDEPGELNQPEGVVVDGDLVWVSDTYNHRILLYRWKR